MNNPRISPEAQSKLESLPTFTAFDSSQGVIEVPQIAKEDMEQITEDILYTKAVVHSITVTVKKVPLKKLSEIANRHMSVATQMIDKTRFPQVGDTVLVTYSFMARDHADAFADAIKML